MADENLDRAIELSKSGKKLEARELLKTILRANRQNETAWLWFADTFPDNPNRIRALEECLKDNPNSQTAQKCLATFKAEEAKKAAVEEQELPEYKKILNEYDQRNSQTQGDSLLRAVNIHQNATEQEAQKANVVEQELPVFQMWQNVSKDREKRTALIECPDCGREISREAEFCSHCGKPSSALHCPMCKSTDVSAINTGAGGVIRALAIAFVAGPFMKKQMSYSCNKCGHEW